MSDSTKPKVPVPEFLIIAYRDGERGTLLNKYRCSCCYKHFPDIDKLIHSYRHYYCEDCWARAIDNTKWRPPGAPDSGLPRGK